jgi:hypothetical protein
MFVLLCPGIFHFTLYLILLSAFSHFLFCIPRQKHSRSHSCTHTHIPVKASHIWIHRVCFSVCVCVCVCARARALLCVRALMLGPGWGVWLHMHVGVNTCVCALCYQLKVRNVTEVPMFALRPQTKTVQLVESLQYTCTPL